MFDPSQIQLGSILHNNTIKKNLKTYRIFIFYKSTYVTKYITINKTLTHAKQAEKKTNIPNIPLCYNESQSHINAVQSRCDSLINQLLHHVSDG